jgi:hypothetical protein
MYRHEYPLAIHAVAPVRSEGEKGASPRAGESKAANDIGPGHQTLFERRFPIIEFGTHSLPPSSLQIHKHHANFDSSEFD